MMAASSTSVSQQTDSTSLEKSIKQKLMKPSHPLPLLGDRAAVSLQHPLLPSLHPLTTVNNGAV